MLLYNAVSNIVEHVTLGQLCYFTTKLGSEARSLKSVILQSFINSLSTGNTFLDMRVLSSSSFGLPVCTSLASHSSAVTSPKETHKISERCLGIFDICAKLVTKRDGKKEGNL